MADADTVAPSYAELWVRNHRKVIISLAPVLLAGFVVIRDAVQAGQAVTAPVVIAAVAALAQTALTYFPGDARVKLGASLVAALAGGVTAAFNDHFTTASLLVVGAQFLAWVSAGAVENGARPDVVRGEVVAGPVDTPVTGSGAPFEGSGYSGE